MKTERNDRAVTSQTVPPTRSRIQRIGQQVLRQIQSTRENVERDQKRIENDIKRGSDLSRGSIPH